LVNTLIAQLQIDGKTKGERNQKLFELALNALEAVIDSEKIKTGKKFPTYDDIHKAVAKGQFKLI